MHPRMSAPRVPKGGVSSGGFRMLKRAGRPGGRRTAAASDAARLQIHECGFYRSGVLCLRNHNVRLDWLLPSPSSVKDEDLIPCP